MQNIIYLVFFLFDSTFGEERANTRRHVVRAGYRGSGRSRNICLSLRIIISHRLHFYVCNQLQTATIVGIILQMVFFTLGKI